MKMQTEAPAEFFLMNLQTWKWAQSGKMRIRVKLKWTDLCLIQSSTCSLPVPLKIINVGQVHAESCQAVFPFTCKHTRTHNFGF